MKKNGWIAIGFAFAMMLGNNIYAGENKSTSETKINSNMKTTTIAGKVVDKNTRETLAGVKIVLDGQKVYTDLDGNFMLTNVSSDKVQLKASLISYEEKTLDVRPDQNTTIQIQLAQHE